jgi:hypothetical protein
MGHLQSHHRRETFMKTAVRALLLLSCLTLVPAAEAADLPKRKSGLWEIKSSHDGKEGMTMQMCIDEKQDDLTAQQADKAKRDIHKQCSKMDMKQSGGQVVIDSTCQFDKFTATGHTVISGQLSTQYTMDSTTRFDPPMHGMAQSHTVMTGRWLSPCKPGQTHGAMSISGLPGGGQFNLDPETLKRMQKMPRP